MTTTTHTTTTTTVSSSEKEFSYNCYNFKALKFELEKVFLKTNSQFKATGNKTFIKIA